MIPRSDIQRLADAIGAKFPVEKVILFGSQAYGTPTEDSDVDLLVVMEYEGRQIDQCVEIWDAVKEFIDFPLDMIIWKPEELSKRYRELNPIARESVDRGALIYDRRNLRVA